MTREFQAYKKNLNVEIYNEVVRQRQKRERNRGRKRERERAKERGREGEQVETEKAMYIEIER